MSKMGSPPSHEALRPGPEDHGAAGSSVGVDALAPGMMAAPGVIEPGTPLRRRPDHAGPRDPDASGTSHSVVAELRRRPGPSASPAAADLTNGVDIGTPVGERPPGADAGNRPGLPDPLRAGLEALSGFDLSDVRVRYDSPEPARHHALAFSRGSDIEVGPGHEEHLAHEGWHVVQQKQGRVKPSLLMKGAPLNADPLLEREADVMGARAVALRRGGDRDGRSGDAAPSPLRHAPVPAPALQLKGEKEFMKDPSAFMEANQVLVSFDEGVQLTYELPAGMIEKIKNRLDQRAAEEMEKVKERQKQDKLKGKKLTEDAYGLSIAMAQGMNKPESIKRAGDTFLTQLMSEAMSAVKCTMFTFATRTVQKNFLGFGGTTQYIVTPFLESLQRSIPAETMTAAPDGTEIPLRDALEGLRRVDPFEAVVQAAYIPYESNPNKVTGETSVDVPIDGDIKVAFTAAMNGCSLAIKKKSDTEMTVWHFPSPDSAGEVWEQFKEEHGIDATYDWNEYNGLTDRERFRLMKNHVTTTVMIRDDEGWKIKSQQNVGPEGGKQQTDLLKVGKVFERRLTIGEETTAEVVDGAVESHD